MKINANSDAFILFAALHSRVRLRIIELLTKKEMNIKQLADATEVSSAIMTKHVRQLEEAGIIRSFAVKGRAGTQKMCSLILNNIEINFPLDEGTIPHHNIVIPIGHYSKILAVPTCGIATTKKIIGQFDDPKYFFSDERVDAAILWFSIGRIGYTFMNPLLVSEQPTSIEISMEICSEAPGYNSKWPSDINFALNGTDLGFWTSPGDFGDRRGIYTPKWWNKGVNQYGLLKIIRIDDKGTFIDGQQMSQQKIEDIDLNGGSYNLDIWVEENAINSGGFTLFGKGFGNYSQNIEVTINYDRINKTGEKI